MRSATFPPLRIEPELRARVEQLLAPGETLSAFVEAAIRQAVEQRSAAAAFGARARASREASRARGRYHSASAVLRDLRARARSARRHREP